MSKSSILPTKRSTLVRQLNTIPIQFKKKPDLDNLKILIFLMIEIFK